VLILAVHSTTLRLGVAMARDRTVLDEIVLPQGREHLENLAPLIRELIGKMGISLKDVDGFAAAVGPGSFSGIRIGLATIKGMALALQKPVIGISTLDVVAWQAMAPGETGICVVDARRSEIYTAAYRKNDTDLTMIEEPMLVKAAEIRRLAGKLEGNSLVVCGDTAAVEAEIANDPRMVPKPVTSPSPGALAELAARALSEGAGRGVHALAPLYIRRSDAEEKARVSVPAAG
jgi:tRNA threonylcarbamoyladenosine biosynthesis protein TsaB